MEPKKLYRSSTNRMICGVCQGIAEYINIDPTVVRLLWVIFSIFGVGLLVYIVAAIIMPVKEQYNWYNVDKNLLKTKVLPFNPEDRWINGSIFYGFASETLSYAIGYYFL